MLSRLVRQPQDPVAQALSLLDAVLEVKKEEQVRVSRKVFRTCRFCLSPTP